MSRKEYLDSRPDSVTDTTCSCMVCHNYHVDKNRNMSVCSQCNKPQFGHREYSPRCLFCAEHFTLQVYTWGDSERKHICGNCGGDNDARFV